MAEAHSDNSTATKPIPTSTPFEEERGYERWRDDSQVLVIGIVGSTNGFPSKNVITNNLFRTQGFDSFPPVNFPHMIFAHQTFS